MIRKICTYLSSKESLPKEHYKQLSNFLKSIFFRQFVSPLDLTRIINSIEVHEFLVQTPLFNQGDAIDKYFFLLSGRVFLKRRTSKLAEKVDIQILDRLGVIGQYFFDSSFKRAAKAETIPEENETIILSIDKEVFHQAYLTQIEEYTCLKEKVSELTSISSETLDSKGLYRSLEWKRFRFGQQLTFPLFHQKVFNILKGECIFNNSSGSLTLMPGDYLNLEGYFNRKEQSSRSKYRIITSEMSSIILSFQFIDKLPKHLIQKLQFLQECHKVTFQRYFPNSQNQSSLSSINESPSQSSLRNINQLFLPKVYRNSTPFKGKEQSPPAQTIGKVFSKVKNVHKPRKSKSIFDPTETGEQELNKFRKDYCLGYQRKGSFTQSPAPKEIREPKGYFQMPSLDREKRSDLNENNRRQWVSYIKQKEKEKEKLKQSNCKSKNKQNIADRRKGQRLKTLFDKFNSTQLLDRFGRPHEIGRHQLKPKTKVFEFPSKGK